MLEERIQTKSKKRREKKREKGKRETERERDEVSGINHNYNQRARKLHQGDSLWPPRLVVALPTSLGNLSSNFGFLQGRPHHFTYIALLPLFREFSR